NSMINGVALSYEETASYVERIRRTVTSMNQALKKAKVPSDTKTEDGSPEVILTKHEILLTTALLAFHTTGCKFCLIESDHKQSDPTRFLPSPFAAAICGTIPSNDRKEILQIRSYISHGIQEIVSAPQNQNAYRVISDTCATVNCRLTIPAKSELIIQRVTLSGSEFIYRHKEYRLCLCGKFQITNAIVVLEILEMLARRGYRLSDEKIALGLRQTKIPSKFEILAVTPTIIADSTHSEIAVETVCDSMADFRPMIGSKIRLCLPEGPIVDRYVQVLTDMNYDIQKVTTLSWKQFKEQKEQAPYSVWNKKLRETVSEALFELQSDEILLISGPNNFTSEIRYEILKVLGF
ncbi:MAG: hypothetical protein IJW46_01080, partial [Clostridia bacterium]|nr:hypothetical protein [Clostridia bacterium]